MTNLRNKVDLKIMDILVFIATCSIRFAMWCNALNRRRLCAVAERNGLPAVDR